MKLPCSRVRLSCKPRVDKHTRGTDVTTADCTYNGVPMAELEQLPRISREDKEKVLGVKASAPPAWKGEAVPLIWGEGRTAANFIFCCGLSFFALAVFGPEQERLASSSTACSKTTASLKFTTAHPEAGRWAMLAWPPAFRWSATSLTRRTSSGSLMWPTGPQLL